MNDDQKITVLHHVERPDLGLGLVRADAIETAPAPPALASELDQWIERRGSTALSDSEEELRQGSRNVLRNGRYKPTGRGKPASEYLTRAAIRDEFPRINGPVDANNLISLKHCVPISLWDLDLSGTNRFEFRLGLTGERYVFNAAGQELDLQDLVCGCGLVHGESVQSASVPIVTPIKDSLDTKLTTKTRRVAGCIYYPLNVGSEYDLAEITSQFQRWLQACGPRAQVASEVLLPGSSVSL